MTLVTAAPPWHAKGCLPLLTLRSHRASASLPPRVRHRRRTPRRHQHPPARQHHLLGFSEGSISRKSRHHGALRKCVECRSFPCDSQPPIALLPLTLLGPLPPYPPHLLLVRFPTVPYDEDNIFKKIIAGDVPSYKVRGASGRGEFPSRSGFRGLAHQFL